MYASVSTWETYLLIWGFLDEESKNIWADMVPPSVRSERRSGQSLGSLVVEGPVLEPGPSLACAIPSASSGRRKARGRCALTQLQRTDCIPRTASHCWALQREQNTPVHMWPFFQLNVKSPPVGGLLIAHIARRSTAAATAPQQASKGRRRAVDAAAQAQSFA